MSKAKTEKERDAEFLRRWGMTEDADGKMVPAVNGPDGWRELAFAPIPKGMLALVPRRPKEGIQAADVPVCSAPLKSVKEELLQLLRFKDEADIKTPEAAAKWRAVFEAAHLDECLLEGISDELARRCTIRAILHLLSRFSTFVKASDGKMGSEELRQLIKTAVAGNQNEGQGASKSYGQLTVYGDFDSVLFAKVHYDLQDAVNARSILRFLCGCAVGKPNAKRKADIREHVSTVNADWRPSQDFRNQLKSLFECVGSHRGMYWIKD